MPNEAPVATLSRLGAPTLGVFRGRAALAHGLTRDQLTRLRNRGVIERVLPDTYRLTAVAPTSEQQLRAALAWAGDTAAATGRSAAVLYGLEGVRAETPEIALPRDVRGRSPHILVRHGDRVAMMVRRLRGIPTTGPEYTLLWLAHVLAPEVFEVAFEDARRRRLTSIPAVRAYLDRFGRRGRPGVAALRQSLTELDPEYAARSTLEVVTRRLLVANGITDFVRELPLAWNGRTYRFDFGFVAARTVLETNGRRWHDDPRDYEFDNEKWSVPGRHGYRLVLATWDKVARDPARLLHELRTTMKAP
jgi:very-short-patch-repair endonuclease